MSTELAKAGLTQLRDVADVTLEALFTALEQTQATVFTGAAGVVRVGDKTTAQIIQEMRGLKSQLLFSTGAVLEAVANVAEEVVTGQSPVTESKADESNT